MPHSPIIRNGDYENYTTATAFDLADCIRAHLMNIGARLDDIKANISYTHEDNLALISVLERIETHLHTIATK